jgi:hypothetical protein
MMRKVALAVAAAVMLCGSSVSGSAFTSAPVTLVRGLSDIHQITFWGRPFPFGYTWSRVRACTEYTPIETENGRTRWQRVWVCAKRYRSYRLSWR